MESTPPNLAGLSALRPATGSDAPLLAALWRRAWASANPLVAEVAPLAHWLERVHAEFGPPCLTLVGVHDGTAVAFMVLDVEAAHLHQLFVDPGAQGTGIGAALVAHVCALPAGLVAACGQQQPAGAPLLCALRPAGARARPPPDHRA